jgi:hypothetical protein
VTELGGKPVQVPTTIVRGSCHASGSLGGSVAREGRGVNRRRKRYPEVFGEWKSGTKLDEKAEITNATTTGIPGSGLVVVTT